MKIKAITKIDPIAKYLNKYNKPATHVDRKKAMKKGEEKHKTPLERHLIDIKV